MLKFYLSTSMSKAPTCGQGLRAGIPKSETALLVKRNVKCKY
jgi:hypothetical protein